VGLVRREGQSRRRKGGRRNKVKKGREDANLRNPIARKREDERKEFQKMWLNARTLGGTKRKQFSTAEGELLLYS